jgi:hypothetical protein
VLPPAITTKQKTRAIARIIEGFMFPLCFSHMNQLESLAIRCISASMFTWFLGVTFDFDA